MNIFFISFTTSQQTNAHQTISYITIFVIDISVSLRHTAVKTQGCLLSDKTFNDGILIMSENSHGYLSFSLFISFLVCFYPGIASAEGPIPAFPGAQGFGSTTQGGRGGKILIVNTLDASGIGSLKEALEYDGPRVVVFKVGGIIDLGNEDIIISSPYLTLAGQTAPGDGVVLKNAGLVIATHDIIIRGMRFRIGDSPEGANPRYRDGIEITNSECNESAIDCSKQPHNIILDHNSISWAVDENSSVWGGAHDITFSWNIISEGLSCSTHSNGCHSMGLLLGPESHNISLHHNIFAHNGERNPQIYNGNSVEMINNIIYNWTVAATIAGGCSYDPPSGSKLNLIGNNYIAGPSTFDYTEDSHTVNRSILISTCWHDAQIYMKDNFGPRLEHTGIVSDWQLAKNETYNTIIADQPTLPLSGVSVWSRLQNLDKVLELAGAISPVRDTTDQRIIEDIRKESGQLKDSQDSTEAWKDYREVRDTSNDRDSDGLPDTWEDTYNLNADSANDAALPSTNNGYSNIENYINFLMLNGQSEQNTTSPYNTDSQDEEDVVTTQVKTGTGQVGWLLYLCGLVQLCSRKTTP